MKAITTSYCLLLLIITTLATAGAATFSSASALSSGSAKSCLDNEMRPSNQQACAGQPSGSNVAYPGNCSLYLSCNCEYPTVMACAPGTWFNPATQNCDWPQNVDCDNSGSSSGTTSSVASDSTTTVGPPPASGSTTTVGPPPVLDSTTTVDPEPCVPPAGTSADLCQNEIDGTVFRYPYNCNAYINCTYGCPVLYFCPPDKVFNALVLICDTPDTAQCVEIPTTTTTELSSTSNSVETTSSTTPLPCEAPPSGVAADFCESQENGSVHSYLENCTAYITCNWDCAELSYCQPGKVFNALLDICDTPDTAECPDVDNPTTTTDIPDNSSTLPTPGMNDTMCLDVSSLTLLPLADDCAVYVECSDGQAIVHDCPMGWLFNPLLLICDEAANMNCGQGTTADTSSSATTDLPTTAPVPNICVGQPSSTTFPYVDNCKLYYYCWGDDTYTILSCPNNNWYNPYTGNCGPDVSPTACQEYSSSSSSSTAAPATTIDPETVCEGQEAGVKYPVPSNCAQYKMCTGTGGYKVLPCPSKNYFNPVTGNCGPNVSPTACQEGEQTSTATTTTEHTTSTINTTPPPLDTGVCGNHTNGEAVPYPDSCQKYIVCVHPVPIAFTCPNNWYFNELTQICDPDNSNCSETGEPTQAPPYGNSTVVPPTICAGAESGDSVPYPQNCQFYIRCTGYDLYMFEMCNDNEYYDPVTGVCGLDVAPGACMQGTTTSTTTTSAGTEGPEPTGLCAGQLDGTKVAYPGNCSKYIVCKTPIAVGYDCVEGLEFSVELQECTSTEEANCSNVANTTTVPTKATEQTNPIDPTTEETTSTISTTTTTEESTTAKESTTTISTTSTSTMPPPQFHTCVGKPDGTLIPYPYNCSKYIACEEPISIGYDCPEGTEFSFELQTCTNPEEANCSNVSNTTTDSTTPTSTTSGSNNCDVSCCGKPDGLTFIKGGNWKQFYSCLNQKALIQTCPSNLLYNNVTGKCDYPPFNLFQIVIP